MVLLVLKKTGSFIVILNDLGLWSVSFFATDNKRWDRKVSLPTYPKQSEYGWAVSTHQTRGDSTGMLLWDELDEVKEGSDREGQCSDVVRNAVGTGGTKC